MPTALTNISSEKHLNLDSTTLTNFADNILIEVGYKEYTVSLVFVDDDKIREMNSRYRDKDAPTNVLSFPFIDGADPFIKQLPIKELGDVVISLDTAHREALEYEEAFSFRICWLIVHGILHLCGMDHERSEEEAEQMAAREKDLLKQYYQANEFCE